MVQEGQEAPTAQVSQAQTPWAAAAVQQEVLETTPLTVAARGPLVFKVVETKQAPMVGLVRPTTPHMVREADQEVCPVSALAQRQAEPLALMAQALGARMAFQAALRVREVPGSLSSVTIQR